ncbi:unnamed protein product [Echinostoma caproni]|uniref:Dynein regulatory complex subunit 7 n=1 Tax=Echinostoma caproni TaxID=27848 RepID=A0A183AX75_9TREM|nr:unnamed protein product [Echinostoma caproni]
MVIVEPHRDKISRRRYQFDSPGTPDDSPEGSFQGHSDDVDEYDEQGGTGLEETTKESTDSDEKSQNKTPSDEILTSVDHSDTKLDHVGPLCELSPLYIPNHYESLPDRFDPDQFPQSYRENNSKEARLLDYCENFRRQYATLCPDRTRLLLAPENECGVEKFVCTTLHPIYLPYPDLYTWDGAASFVADFLQFVPLVPSTELPKRLLSPSTVASIQKGTCFDYATLLCSLLLGVGYDAYVVSGYATRECCYMDETRLLSPFQTKEAEIKPSEEETESKKYVIKQPKDLTSQYEQACMAKEINAEVERAQKEKERLELEDEEANKPPKDPLFGLRVHAWILVLAGKREVPEAFFIEPLTGLSHPLDTPLYLGIESLWNATNYWVNMQDCSTGIAHLKYDLENGLNWEYLLPSGSLRLRAGLNDIDFPRNQISETSDLTCEGLHVQSTLNFELISHDSTQSSHVAPVPPAPMANSLGIGSNRLFRTSTSGDVPKLTGTKQVASRCRVEKFAPFSENDGVIFRLTNYEDAERTQPVDVLEKFAQRADKLLSRFTVVKTKQVTETFDHGRSGTHLAEHIYYRHQQAAQTNRTMKFYHVARVDGLEKRIQTPTTMQEFYVGRKDRMYYREVLFGGKIKKFGPAQVAKDTEGGALVCVTTTSQLNIDRITERFSRDESKDADDDLAERIFYIAEDRIFLTYHIGEDRIAPCTREFIKPPPSDDRRNSIQLYSDTHSTFQVRSPFSPVRNPISCKLCMNQR